MSDPINDRLAARLEQLHIERLIRVESIAKDTDETVAVAVDRVLAAAVSRRESKQLDMALILSRLPDELNVLLERQFVRLAYWSRKEFSAVMARTIPRKWFRAANPKAILVGEDHEPDEVNIDPAVTVTTAFEPIVRERLTDEEWAAWVEENVFPPPSHDYVMEIIHRPNAGVDYAERIRALSKLVQPDAVAATMAQGIANGRNVAELSKDVLKHVEGGIKASARRIARTEGLRVANTMQRESYDELGDIYIGIQILETLDQHTRPHHALRHGAIYYNDGREPSITDAPNLPDEANCRGMDVPVMRMPEELANDPLLAPVFQNAAGFPIPDAQDYSQWWAGADVPRQKLAVGVGRWNTMAKRLDGMRAPEWEDFIDAKGRRLKVGELNAETFAEREARRQEVFAAIRSRSALLGRIQ